MEQECGRISKKEEEVKKANEKGQKLVGSV